VFYNSTCHGCIQACPCKVYLEDGVVVKIEGHPDAPVSQGSLCLKGLNQIHTCYGPRRVLYPLKRTGARGAANAAWERISWDEAVELAASKIVEAIKNYGTYALMASVGGGGGFFGAPTIITVVQSLGAPTVFEPGCAQCYLPRIAAARYMYGGADQSIADCAVLEPFKGLAPLEKAKGVTQDTKVMVLWGAQPSVSQTSQSGRGMADLRAAGCKTIVIDPNYTPDAVKATIYLPVRPGADAALILSWYRVILDEKLYDEEFTKFYTNLPFLIGPDKLPLLAADVLGPEAQTTPADTPVYLCINEDNGQLSALPFGNPEDIRKIVNPQVLGSINVPGIGVCRTAGQIYRDEADPWTLEKTEEFCWVKADRNRAAIDLYAKAEVAGIAHGVATDMEENASQAPFGALGLDMIMGYVNKPGATLTQNTAPKSGDPRPTLYWTGIRGTYGSMYGIGYKTGTTAEDNEARIAAIPDKWDSSMDTPEYMTKPWLYALNQMMLDRVGMKNHKGLYEWSHSQIPAVREMIETGEPYHPRVWIDLSGNKFAMLGSAGAWYNAVMNGGVDFVITQHPMLTSFHIEIADLVFPTEEWLEATNCGRGQLNYTFPSPGIIHLGETAPHNVAPQRIVAAASKMLNDYIDQGNKVVFGFEGAKIGSASRENGSYYHGNTIDTATFRFPLGSGVMGGISSEEESWVAEITKLKAFPELESKLEGVTDRESLLAALVNDPDFYGARPPDQYWLYDQHLVMAADGLPMGFATESRKCEVYVQLVIKMGRNGFPYCYPIPQVPIDPSIATYDGDYSPICNVPKQKEVPTALVDPSGFADPASADFPLALTSGRLYHFHHGTMRQSPFARELYPEPFVRINPKTAAEYGIAHGDWVEISSARTQGEPYDPIRRTGTKTAEPIRAIAYVAEVVAPNVLWMERFWNPECFDSTQPNKTGGWQECNVNVITNAVDAHFNEVFGSYTNRGITVNIKKSEKPANVWTQPKQFEPFMPTTANEYVPSIGVLLTNKELLTKPVAFAATGGGQ
jgi:anaerobic selenocysteine-containing dehydrogenase